MTLVGGSLYVAINLLKVLPIMPLLLLHRQPLIV